MSQEHNSEASEITNSEDTSQDVPVFEDGIEGTPVSDEEQEHTPEETALSQEGGDNTSNADDPEASTESEEERRELTPEELAEQAEREARRAAAKAARARRKSVAWEISDTLREKDRKPRAQIKRIVELMGEDFSRNLLEETLTIEADGGMMIQSGERRRTAGGVFFFLARSRMPEEKSLRVFYNWRAKTVNHMLSEKQYTPFAWDERASLLEAPLFQEKGEVSEVQIMLSGRPSEIERRQELIIITMEDQIKESLQLPRGVPHPGQWDMTYTVYISSRQWEKVDKALEKEDDKLVIEGFTGFDEETNTMAVFATFVTTKRLAKRDRKGDEQGDAKDAGKKQKGGKKDKAPQADKKAGRDKDKKGKREEQAPAPAPVPVEINLPPGLPPEVAQKLTELYRAAATFQQKIDLLESKPANEQFGLEMTQKLLKNTQTQIARLEKQYVKDN